jgi:hypothetical protein
MRHRIYETHIIPKASVGPTNVAILSDPYVVVARLLCFGIDGVHDAVRGGALASAARWGRIDPTAYGSFQDEAIKASWSAHGDLQSLTPSQTLAKLRRSLAYPDSVASPQRFRGTERSNHEYVSELIRQLLEELP